MVVCRFAGSRENAESLHIAHLIVPMHGLDQSRLVIPQRLICRGADLTGRTKVEPTGPGEDWSDTADVAPAQLQSANLIVTQHCLESFRGRSGPTNV